MAYTRKISEQQKAMALYYRRELHHSYRQIAKKCNMSASSVARICNGERKDKRSVGLKNKRGRPRKLDERSVRKLIRCITNARKTNPNMTVKTLVTESGLSLELADRRTFSRRLNENGYGFFQVRKKGLMNEKDKKLRRKYARQMKHYMKRNPNFWKDEVAFYLDGVSFVYKHNPLNSANAPNARIWRKKCEGLLMTGRGSKELAGGKRLHLIVAIAYGKGVVLKVPYEKMSGGFFEKFVRQTFNLRFAKCGPKKNGRRLFLMDNDLLQTSKAARQAMQDIEAEFHKIPARSPNLNPIENIFHLVKKNLGHEAIANCITSETFKQFTERVLRSFDNHSIAVVDRTIASLSKRVEAVLKSKGNRIKY